MRTTVMVPATCPATFKQLLFGLDRRKVMSLELVCLQLATGAVAAGRQTGRQARLGISISDGPIGNSKPALSIPVLDQIINSRTACDMNLRSRGSCSVVLGSCRLPDLPDPGSASTSTSTSSLFSTEVALLAVAVHSREFPDQAGTLKY